MSEVQYFPYQQYSTNENQKCFVGHSIEAYWRIDLVSTCDEVLPESNLQPWYAANHFDPNKPLRKKVVELIANTVYGIYDLSYWQKDDKSEWIMPRNVLIELGIAIALNRPMLLLRHVDSRYYGPPLPKCFDSLSKYILEFAGGPSLKRTLRDGLSELVKATTSPEQDWWNRYCNLGRCVCKYREMHPHMQQRRHNKLLCHISDGEDNDQIDFREDVKEILERYSDVSFVYLDELTFKEGYTYLLCSYCQAVRSTPFAIYRITPQTSAETFIAIGMSLALETQFEHTIPKIFLTENMSHIPSLLTGYEVVLARSSYDRVSSLRKLMPSVLQDIRKTVVNQKQLPFIEIQPKPSMPTTKKGNVDNNPKIAKRMQIAASQVTDVLRQAQTFQTQGRFTDAIDLCEQILANDFDRPDARYFLGWLYQEQRRWDEAIRQFQAILKDPDYALSCYYALGQCYRAKGDMRAATQHFDEAVDRVNLDALTVDEADELVQLCQEAAEAHRILGEQEQALTVYNALLGFLRSRQWNDKVPQVEFLLKQMQSTPPPPPQNSGSLRELPDWLTGILNDADKAERDTVANQQESLAILRVEEGKESRRIYEIRKESLSIGRSRESDIFLEDLAVSRLHASIISLGNNSYALRDEGSVNGTKVNGQLVNKYQPYPLLEGDKIQIGQSVLAFSKR